MMTKAYFMTAEGGYTTLMISNEAMDEVLQTLLREAYNEGYTDGANDNIRAD